jgi:hypothetical protein
MREGATASTGAAAQFTPRGSHSRGRQPRRNTRRGVVVVAGSPGWFGGGDSDEREDARAAYAEQSSWFERRGHSGGLAARRSPPLRPLSHQGASLLHCIQATPDLFDNAVATQVRGSPTHMGWIYRCGTRGVSCGGKRRNARASALL